MEELSKASTFFSGPMRFSGLSNMGFIYPPEILDIYREMAWALEGPLDRESKE